MAYSLNKTIALLRVIAESSGVIIYRECKCSTGSSSGQYHFVVVKKGGILLMGD
jgi:hypothetical protein